MPLLKAGSGYDAFASILTQFTQAQNPKKFLQTDPTSGAAFKAVLDEFNRPLTVVKNTATQAILSVDGYYFVIDGSSLNLAASGAGDFADYAKNSAGTVSTIRVYQGGSVSGGTYSGGSLITTAAFSATAATLTVGNNALTLTGANLPTGFATVQALYNFNYTGSDIGITGLQYRTSGTLVDQITLPSSPLFSAINDYQAIAKLFTGNYGDVFKQNFQVLQLSTTQLAFSNSDGILLVQGTNLHYTGSWSQIDPKSISGTVTGAQLYVGGTYNSTTHAVTGGSVAVSAVISATQLSLTAGNMSVVFDGTGLPTDWATWISIFEQTYAGSALGIQDLKIVKDGQQALTISLTGTELDITTLGYKIALTGTFDTSVIASIIQGTTRPNLAISGVTVTKVSTGDTVLTLSGISTPISLFDSTGHLSLNALFDSVTAIDESASASGVKLSLGTFSHVTTLIGGSGSDTVEVSLNGNSSPITAIPIGNRYNIFDLNGQLYSFTSVENLSIVSGSGNDILVGGAGNDTLNGAGGSNYLDGGDGNDTLYVANGDIGAWGGNGDDTLIVQYTGSQPIYVLDGGAGSDTAIVDMNSDGNAITASGSGTTYTISDTTGTLYSFSGVESFEIYAGSGNDTITGGAGNDKFSSWNGADTMLGGGGNDTFEIGIDLNPDSLDGGSGNDTAIVNVSQLAYQPNVTAVLWTSISANSVTAKLTINNNGTYTTAITKYASFANIENFVITGTTSSDYFSVGAGNYTLDGNYGYDYLSFGSAATGGVTVNLNIEAAQSLGGGLGTVALRSIEDVTGTAYNDTLIGNAQNNAFNGGAGNDYIDGGSGTDTVYYTTATSGVTVNLGLTGAQSVGGGMGSDTLVNIENLIGSNYADTLTGNGGNNVLQGGSGNDVLNGGGGNDTASYVDATGGVTVNLTIATAQSVGGGLGSDTLSSIENLTGSGYNDTLTGDGNNNTLQGGAGNDVLNGGAGNDTASYADATSGVTVSLAVTTAQSVGGGLGSDTLSSIENLIGSQNGDTLIGDGGDNILDANGGWSDSLFGGAGNDILIGGDNSSTLEGGAGNDTLIGHGNWNIASYVSATGGVTVDLSLTGSQSVGGGMGSDSLSDIYGLIGSNYADTLTGDAKDNSLYGGNGADTLNGGDGNDYLIGGFGSDTLNGGNGNDTLFAGHPYQSNASDGNDVLNGGAGDDSLHPGQGASSLNGGDGSDTIYFDSATSGVTVNLSVATAQSLGGGLGSVTLSSIENIYGSYYNDTLIGDGGNNTISGGGGNDSIDGGAGDDSLVVWSGTNTLVGNDGNDMFSLWGGTNVSSGGAGNDSFALGSGTNSINGGDGNDTITVTEQQFVPNTTINGGAGSDTVVLTGYYVDRSQSGGNNNAIVLGANTITNVETIRLTGGTSYELTVSDGTVAAGQVLTVDASALGSDDYLTFGGGSETDGRFIVTGGAGSDFIKGGAGADTLNGGAGNDMFKTNGGNDVVDGGTGWNRVSFSGAAHGVTVDLRLQGSAQNTTVGQVTLTNIQDITGTTYADTLIGDGGDNWLWGLGGNDSLSGGAGNDLIDAAPSGTQTVDGGTGNNTLSFGHSWGSTSGGVTFSLAVTGAQTAGTGSVTATNFQNVVGTVRADTLTGDAQDNNLYGDDGADTLSGGAGNDTLYGDAWYQPWDGSGIDGPRIVMQEENASLAGNDVLNGGTGNDTLIGGYGNDTMDGGSGRDTAVFLGPSAAYTITRGTGGTVTITGLEGTDVLTHVEYAKFYDKTVSLAAVAPHDFDGDGKSDIIWENTTTGQDMIWLMDGTTRVSKTNAGGPQGAEWKIIATGDFDGDGKADIVWENTNIGQDMIWLMNGTTRVAKANAGGAQGTDWKIITTGDFDGDGKSDILWENTTLGLDMIWLMNGTTRVAKANAGGAQGAEWKIVAAGDFNGDGKSDILWENTNTGQDMIWLMDGTTRIAKGNAGGAQGAGWVIAGTGDFNGDGKSDILWEYTPTGQDMIWLMDGTTRLSKGNAGGPQGSGWTIIGTGDYNGDGKSDILWEYTPTGQDMIWLMDGTTRLSVGAAGGAQGSTWLAVGGGT